MKIVPSQIMKIYESSLVGRQGLYERGYKVRAAGNISIIQRLILYLLGNKSRSSVIVCFLNTSWIWPEDLLSFANSQNSKTPNPVEQRVDTPPRIQEWDIWYQCPTPPHHPNQQSLWWIEGVLHGSRGNFISQTLWVFPGVLNSMICQPTIIVQAEYKSRREYYLADKTNWFYICYI